MFRKLLRGSRYSDQIGVVHQTEIQNSIHAPVNLKKMLHLFDVVRVCTFVKMLLIASITTVLILTIRWQKSLHMVRWYVKGTSPAQTNLKLCVKSLGMKSLES